MLVAKRPVVISGVRFLIGETITTPLSYSEISRLIGNGLIEEVEDVKTEIKTQKEVKKTYNKEKLKSLKKSKLVEIAKEENIDTTDKTAKEIISAIKSQE